jgi:hypothetical protein
LRQKRVLPQGVAHQAARRVFLVGVKNRLMPRELAASVRKNGGDQMFEIIVAF